jgi:hypothetical protein
MTDLDQTHRVGRVLYGAHEDEADASPLAGTVASAPVLDIVSQDVSVSLLSFAAGLILLAFAARFATAPAFVGLYAASLIMPGFFLAERLREKGDITIPVLLLLTTIGCGPLGALGCAFMARSLRRRQPSPARLASWYAYIAGVVARDRSARIYEELSSGRLPRDPIAEIPRFRPVLSDGSTEEQQRVLSAIGRRYHSEFRAALRQALRNKNGFIRAQAAAVASRLDVEEKKSLWSGASSQEKEKKTPGAE